MLHAAAVHVRANAPRRGAPYDRSRISRAGGNLASPLEQVNAALKAIADIPDNRIVRCLRFTARRRLVLGSAGLPERAAVALDTALAPRWQHTQRIEAATGPGAQRSRTLGAARGSRHYAVWR